MNLKYFLIFMVLATGFTDFVSFYTGNIHSFEINPIFIFTQSLLFMFVFKFSILILLCWLINKFKPTKSYVNGFMLVFISVLVIFAQALGTYSNIKTKQEFSKDPINIKPLEQDQAVKTYFSFTLFFAYIPIIINYISFLIFERIYLKGVINVDP